MAETAIGLAVGPSAVVDRAGLIVSGGSAGSGADGRDGGARGADGVRADTR